MDLSNEVVLDTVQTVDSMSVQQLKGFLQSPSHSPNQKLEVASYIFGKSSVVLLNKHTFLLDWLTSPYVLYIPNDRKNLFLEEEKYWNLLLSILESSSVSSATILRTSLLNAVSYAIIHLETPSTLEIVERVFEKLFSKFSSTFVPSIDQYSTFITSILEPLLSSPATSDKWSERSLSLYKRTLTVLIQVQRKQINQKKVFITFVSKLLQPLSSLYYKFKNEHQQLEFCDIIEQIVEKSLFHPSHLSEFSMSFTQSLPSAATSETNSSSVERPSKKSKQEDGETGINNKQSSYQKQLFDKLRELLHSEARNMCELLPLLLRCFLRVRTDIMVKEAARSMKRKQPTEKVAKSTPSIEYRFFYELFQIIQSIRFNPSTNVSTLQLIRCSNGLLQLVAQFNVYSSKDDPNEEKLKVFTQYRDSILKLIDTADQGILIEVFVAYSERRDLDEEVFSGLHTLLDLNHLLIEEVMVKTWQLFSVHIQKYDVTVSPFECCSLTANQIQLESLAVHIVQMYGKLRQLDKLLLLIFEATKSASVSKSLFISKKFLEGYCLVVQQLPPGQLTVIWELFLTEAGKYVSSYHLQSSFECFCEYWILFMENAVITSNNATALFTYVDHTHDRVILPLFTPLLDSLKNSSKLKSAPLYLCTLMNVYSALNWYHDNCALDLPEPSTSVFKYIFTSYEHINMSSFVSLVESLYESVPRNLQVLLTTVVIQHIRWHGGNFPEDSELSKLMEFLFRDFQSAFMKCCCHWRHSEEVMEDSLLWRGMLIPLTDEAVRAARWLEISSNIQHLAVHMNEEQKKMFLAALIHPCECFPAPLPHWMGETLTQLPTLGMSCGLVLLRLSFYELQPLKGLVMKTLLHYLYEAVEGAIASPECKELKRVVSQVATKTTTNATRQQMSSALVKFTEQLPRLKLGKFKEAVRIRSLLQLIKAMPTEYFSNEDVEKCLLLTLAIDMLCKCAKKKNEQIMNLADTTRKLLGLYAKARSAAFTNVFSADVVWAILHSIAREKKDEHTSVNDETSLLRDTLIIEAEYVRHLLKEEMISNGSPSHELKRLFELLVNFSGNSSYKEDMRNTFMQTLREVVLEKEKRCVALAKAAKEAQELQEAEESSDGASTQLMIQIPGYSIPKHWRNSFVAQIETQVAHEIQDFDDTQQKAALYKFFNPIAQILDFYRLYFSEFQENSEPVIQTPLLEYLPKFLSLANEALVTSSEESDAAIEFLRVLALTCRYFEPAFSVTNFAKLLALIFSLLSTHAEESEVSSKLYSVYSSFVQSSSREQLILMIRHIKAELAATSNNRITAAIRCCSKIVAQLSGARRLALLNKKLLSIVILGSVKVQSVLAILDILQRLMAAEKIFELTTRDINFLFHGLTPLFTKRYAMQEDLFMGYYRVLYSAIKHRPKETYRAVPSFIEGIRFLLLSVVDYPQDADGKQVILSETCKQNVARLYEEVSQHSIFKKYMVYMISDFIQLMQTSALSTDTKKTLLPGLFALFDCCTDAEYQLLQTYLDSTGKSLFKSLHADYKQTHKFTGKV